MKNILLVSLLQFTFLNLSISQTSYNSQIEKLAKEISLKIDSSNHSRIAIMDFINGEKKVTQLGETISEDLSAELANYSNNQKKFEIFERSRVVDKSLKRKI